MSLDKAFKFFDTDNDKIITIKELNNGIQKLGINLNNKDVELIFNHLDSNTDGKIDQ